jgi:hypothetical protein
MLNSVSNDEVDHINLTCDWNSFRDVILVVYVYYEWVILTLKFEKCWLGFCILSLKDA